MSEETENTTENQTFEELCDIYGSPDSRKRANAAPVNKLSLACGITAFAAIAVLYLVAAIFYTRPVVDFGGNKQYGQTQNIFSYMAVLIDRISEQIEGLANLSTEDMLGILSLAQDAIAFAFAIVYLIIQTIILIRAIIRFVNKKYALLPSSLVSSLACNMCVYVIYNFVCNVSGGEGISYYYAGDIPSLGMDIVMVAAVCALVACIALQSVNMRQNVKGNNLFANALKMYICVAAGAAVWLIFALMPMSRVFGYVMSGSIVSAILSITTNSFSPLSLLFSFANTLILFSSLFIFIRIAIYIKTGVKNLFDLTALQYAEVSLKSKPRKRKNVDKPKKRRLVPITPFVLSALSLIAVCLMRIPELGLGWSVDLLPSFISLTVIFFVWGAAITAIGRIFRKRG